VVRTPLDVRRRRQVFEIPVSDPQVVRVGDGGGIFARIHLKQDREAWTRALLMDTDVAGRMDAAEALLEWPDLAAADLGSALSKDPFWAVRREAAHSLGRISGESSLKALLGAVADPDARVREAVAEAMGDRTRGEAAAALRPMLDSDANPYVRAAAARALGKVRAEGAFDALAALLKVDSHRETLRAAALDGLRSLGDRRALDLARPWLRYDFQRGDHHAMRESALKVLLALAPDEPETNAAVVALLDDPWHRTRALAAETAGHYKVAAAEAKLRVLAEKDPFDGVRNAAKAALDKIAPPPKK
jgi:HEAT repeat protein